MSAAIEPPAVATVADGARQPLSTRPDGPTGLWVGVAVVRRVRRALRWGGAGPRRGTYADGMPRRRAGVLLPIEDQILQLGLDRNATGDPEFHGFVLAEELSAEGAAGLRGHGTLYKALARLERDGLLTSRWEEIDASAEGRPRRRLYRVTGLAASALMTSRQLQTTAAAQTRLAPS